jgi:diguanylate cyclase
VIGSIAEITLWLVLLGQRVQAIRRAGEDANRKHDALRSLALTDALTGLVNRRGLEPVLADAVGCCRPDRLAAVFMIDLDGFKQVNDRHGHDAGDLLLIAVADRLNQCVRRSNCVSRLGGDEFVVVASGFDSDAAARQFGQKLIEVFAQPFRLAGIPDCRVRLTIDYALAPVDGRDMATLLRRADLAMYAGKQGGKHCLRRTAPDVEPAMA